MDVRIIDRNVGLSQQQRENVERCLQFALDRFSTHLRNIEISFTDINGPRGGEDLQCRMHIALEGKGDLTVEGKGSSVEAVAAETADRAAVAFARRLDRLSDMQGVSMSGQ